MPRRSLIKRVCTLSSIVSPSLKTAAFWSRPFTVVNTIGVSYFSPFQPPLPSLLLPPLLFTACPPLLPPASPVLLLPPLLPAPEHAANTITKNTASILDKLLLMFNSPYIHDRL